MVVSQDNNGPQIVLAKYNSPIKTMNMPRLLPRSTASGLTPAVAPGSMVGNQLFASYLYDYFPANPSCPFDMSHIIISSIYMLPPQSLMLEKAKSALSCVFLSKLHRDRTLLQYGLSLYTQAIQSMSKALSRKAYSYDIIYACVIFGQIEVRSRLFPPRFARYKVHRKLDPSLPRVARPMVYTHRRTKRNYEVLSPKRGELSYHSCDLWPTSEIESGERTIQSTLSNTDILTVNIGAYEIYVSA